MSETFRIILVVTERRIIKIKMKLESLCNSLSLKVMTGDTEREFSGVYVGDFLSRAMTCVKQDYLWITIMTNSNVIAVASLTDAAAVLLAEDVVLLPDALEAARENGITILSSFLDAYRLCLHIGKLLEES